MARATDGDLRRSATRHALVTALLAIVFAASATAAQDEPRAVQEIRRVLEELPTYGVFDWITFEHDRGHVTLDGFARDPSLKGATADAVGRVEGVEQVTNRIETLSSAASDETLRQEIHRAIYRDSPLSRYGRADGTAAIHIVVNRGNVMLAGIVERTDDKRLAELKARSVFGVRKVENALSVSGQAR